MSNYNNNLIKSSLIEENIDNDNQNVNRSVEEKYLEVITKNKQNEENIKKLEEENKNLRYNITNNLLNTNINSAYNYLMKEVETISKEKIELETKLNNLIKEKNDSISKYITIDIENRQLKAENNSLKNINKNLFDEIQKYKSEDIQKAKIEKESLNTKLQELSQKSKGEVDSLNLKIKELEKEKSQINEKLIEFQKKFNHDYGMFKKIRLILNYLNNINQTLESKINEYEINKNTSQTKIDELQHLITKKNEEIVTKNKELEEYKKKLDEQIFKYGQLNNEFTKLNEISKEISVNTEQNNNCDVNIKKSFSELIKCLIEYKEVVPFLNKKLEIIEIENNNLKKQLNDFNVEANNKTNEIIKMKDKEIEEFKNIINTIKKEKEKLENEKNILNSENSLIKNDIVSICQFINDDKVKEKSNETEDENLLSELLNQLNKSRNIISFLLPQK